MRIAITFLSLLLAYGTARGATANVRVLLCDKPIAESIKRHLDGGKLPAEAFEATYERLKAGRQVEELFRFSQQSPDKAALYRFQTPGAANGEPADRWQASIELETPNSSEPLLNARWAFDLMAPKDRKSGVSPFYRSNSLTLLPPETWNVVDEFHIGERVLLSLVRVIVPATDPGDSSPGFLIVEGYILARSASEAESFVKKPAVDLANEADHLKASGKSENPFRFRMLPGQIATHEKGDPEAPRYRADSLSDTEATRIQIQMSLSPDGTLVDCLSTASLFTQSGSADPVAVTIPVGATFPTGTWVAFPSSRGARGQSREGAVLLLRIDYRPSPASTLEPQRPQKPLPPSGTATRVYYARPDALRVLSGGNNPGSQTRAQLSTREIFLHAGVPAGNWTITCSGTNTLLLSGTPEVHEKVIEILEKFRWEGPVLRTEAR